MQFLFPALAAGFLFVAVPPLVHLINMLRHRRQSWAAMDFLMASYRKQKKWIILRQLLLLLCRVAVAAVLIAMLAGWTGASGWLDALGGQTTHHVVVLDDSYSTSDSSGGSQAYDRALAALDGLSRRLAVAEGNHQLTVIRSSRAALVVRGGSDSGDAAADMSAAALGSDLRAVERIMATEPSPMDDGPAAALGLAVELVKATPATRTVLYVMSDFRQRDWQNAERASEAIQAIISQGAEVRLIDGAVDPAPNLSITALEPLPDVWVAGVPVVFRVAVRNHGTAPVRNVALALRAIEYGGQATAPDPAERFSGQVEALPSVVFEQIAAGEQVTKQFQVFIAESGTHAIEVELPEDAVRVDNRRTSTLPLSDVSRVLIVDGDVEGRGAYHVSSVLDPGGQVRTGAVPDIRPPSFLRTATVDSLAAYRAVYLIDLPEVDASTATALEQYVRQGGGLMWFVGAGALASRYNEVLLGNERGLLPGELTEALALSASGATTAPDITLAAPHPLTEPLAAIGDAALSLVRVSRSMGISLDGKAPMPIQRIFDRRDDEPLVLQHDLGRGRIITVLAGLDDGWMNWTGDPTFVVFMLRANAYLWSAAAAGTHRRVDEAVVLDLAEDQYARAVTFMAAVDEPPRLPLEEQAEPTDDGVLRLEISPLSAAIETRGDLNAILHPGISEFWLTRLDGSPDVRLSSGVVSPLEGDLTRAEQEEIRSALKNAPVTFYSTEDVIASDETSGVGLMSLVLFCMLGLLLAGEQILAFFASYHPPLHGARP